MSWKIQFLILSFVGSTMVATEESRWLDAEQRARNAVVQVWAQSTHINFLYPYKSPEQSQAAGSGFFIDQDGHFLTNYHVVRGAKSVYVNVQEVGRMMLKATVVGVCPVLDVALLRLTPESRRIVESVCGSINALEFGDSDALYETQPVLSLGFPQGFRTEKSCIGEVAGRDCLEGNSYVHVTIPSNPGNSGGPVLSTDGKVVGILTMGLGDAENYNYIVPINDILIILSDLYKTRLVRRPDFGVGANRGTEAHARSLHNPVPAGLYINYVLKDSMEEKAGLLAGDMLYEVIFNGSRYEVNEFGEVSVAWRVGQKISFEELLNRCRIGDQISFIIYRKGEKKVLNSVFESPKLLPIRYIYPEYEPEELDYEMIGGMVVMQLRENHLKLFLASAQLGHLHEFREYDRHENYCKNVLTITAVLAGSAIHLAECLSVGFILHRVNGKPVTTLKELREALMLSVKTGEIYIETKDKPATILSLQEVLEDETRISADFMFPITPFVRKMMDAVAKKP